MTFNPNDHMTKYKGKDYLPAYARIMWFRDQNPSGVILTELVNLDPPVIKATISNESGQIVATGHGMAIDNGKVIWTGRSVEKAETAAISRALAHAGFGTQFAEEDDTDYLADNPIDIAAPPRQNGATRPAPAPEATITSAVSEHGQIELVGAYSLTPAQLETNLDRVSWALVNKTVMTNPTIFEVKEPNHFDNLKKMYLKEHENDQDGLAVDLTVGAALQWFKEHREERNRATA